MERYPQKNAWIEELYELSNKRDFYKRYPGNEEIIEGLNKRIKEIQDNLRDFFQNNILNKEESAAEEKQDIESSNNISADGKLKWYQFIKRFKAWRENKRNQTRELQEGRQDIESEKTEFYNRIHAEPRPENSRTHEEPRPEEYYNSALHKVDKKEQKNITTKDSTENEL